MNVTVEEELDTNIYNTYDLHNEFDFITRVKPGISLNLNEANFFSGINKKRQNSNNRSSQAYTSGRQSNADLVPGMQIGLSLDLEYYMLHPKLDSWNSSGNGFFQPDFNINIYPDDNLNIYYRYNRTRNDISLLDPLEKSGDQDKVYTSTHRYGFNFDFGQRRDVWTLSYEHTETKNENEGYLDRSQDNWSLNVTATNPPSYLPKVFLEFDHSGDSSGEDSSSDKTTNEVFIGLKGNFSPKITGTVKAGYSVSSPDSNIFDFSNLTGDLVYDVDLNYNISNKVNVGFSFNKTQRDISSFTVDSAQDQDDDAGEAAGPGLNIPRSSSDSWTAAFNVSYTPPFFSENLRLTGTASQSEVEYSDGGRQRVQEIGFGYSYTWPGIQHKKFRGGGSNRSNNRRGVSSARSGSGYGGNFLYVAPMRISGDVRTRRVSPDIAWSRFTDNVITLNVKWEF